MALATVVEYRDDARLVATERSPWFPRSGDRLIQLCVRTNGDNLLGETVNDAGSSTRR
jgi:hypothetical protein